MAQPKRTKDQIARDRVLIADRYLMGWTQAHIAEWLNSRDEEDRDYTLSRPAIAYDIKAIREEWKKSTLVDFNEARNRELAKVDRLEKEYWDAWTRSCEASEIVTTKEGQSDTKGDYSEIQRRIKYQAGDPRFLQGVHDCIKQRCKLLGVEAPEVHEHDVGPKLESALRALPGEFKVGVLAALAMEAQE